MAKKKSPTREEVTREVERLFCRGLSRELILDYAKAHRWGISEAVLSALIDKTKSRLIEIGAALNLDTEVGKALDRLNTLYDDAVEAKDTKTALAVQKEIISMLHLGEHARQGVARVPAETSKPARPFRIA
jgi:hypothetical protein